MENEFEMENYIYNMLDKYRDKYSKYLQAWEALAAIAGISRNAVYSIIRPNKNARLDTIVKLSFTLGLTYEDFNTLLAYNGLCLRPFIESERIIDSLFRHNDLGDIPPSLITHK